MRPTPSGADLLEPMQGWFESQARDLPWREPSCSPWGVLVSEVMLQQTPVARVEPVWRQWLARWPEPADLAAEAPGEAVRAWGRLGYPRRALRLHACAVALTAQHAGQVPADLGALLALPGVGQYTAAAVGAFAFGLRSAVVDTNVRRVQARAVSGLALPAPALSAAELRLAQELLPPDPEAAAAWNAAVMELGALVCTARAPACTRCPLAHRCAWLQAGSPAYSGPARRSQSWAGTDRQCRGVILAALRESEEPLPVTTLARAWPDAAQFHRSLEGLLVDGLVERAESEHVALPGLTA